MACNEFDAAWQMVTCGRCRGTYVCQPSDDFNSCAQCDVFPANTPNNGLCDECLWWHHIEAHPRTSAPALPGGRDA